MKRTIFFTLCLFAVPFVTHAQTKALHKSPSLLYQVSGKGLAKASYIFGTFHAICPGDIVALERLDTYLNQSDQLMMEIDMDDPVEMASMGKAIIMPGGKTIRDFLTAEQFAKVDEMVKNFLGYSVENLKSIKPSIITVIALTSPKAIGCKPTALDSSLMQNAVAKKKAVVGLETVASQIAVIDSHPFDKQAKTLYEMAQNPQKSVDELKRLMAVYKLQDSDKLFKVVNSQLTKDKEFQARLLEDRNHAWIPKLETAFREKPTFVAVGAGHLGGKNGVIRLLRAKGYQVVPIKL